MKFLIGTEWGCGLPLALVNGMKATTVIILTLTLFSAGNVLAANDLNQKLRAARQDEQLLKKDFKKLLKKDKETEVSQKDKDVVDFLNAEIHWKKPSKSAER